MKTPPNPLGMDLADAVGKDSRRKRDQVRHIARAKSTCAVRHTENVCNGTETLAMIERALLRLSTGTYGICVSCGADISLDRLDKDPTVETCKSCRSETPFKSC